MKLNIHTKTVTIIKRLFTYKKDKRMFMSTDLKFATDDDLELALVKEVPEYGSEDSYYKFLDENYDAITSKKIKAFIKYNYEKYHFIPLMTVSIINEFGVNNFMEHSYKIRGSVSGKNPDLNFKDTSQFFIDNKNTFNLWGEHVAEKLEVGNYLRWLSNEFTCFYPDFTFDDVVGYMCFDNRNMEGFDSFANHACWSLAVDTCVNYNYFSANYDTDSK